MTLVMKSLKSATHGDDIVIGMRGKNDHPLGIGD